MSKNIKDYLHLYLGCECICNPLESPYGNDRYYLMGINVHGMPSAWVFYDADDSWHVPLDSVKPILRPLSDMTEEEKREMDDIPQAGFAYNSWIGERAKWLLSKHFDLFGLIESGLAIDKNQTK